MMYAGSVAAYAEYRARSTSSARRGRRAATCWMRQQFAVRLPALARAVTVGAREDEGAAAVEVAAAEEAAQAGFLHARGERGLTGGSRVLLPRGGSMPQSAPRCAPGAWKRRARKRGRVHRGGGC